jgi:tripeptide aminopeptidase
MSDRLVNTFCEMVKIGSESGNEKAFLSYLAGLFTQNLHADCRFDGFGNLIARLPAKGCAGKPPVLFGCHGDTVKPGQGIEPVVIDGVVRSQGETILGADDKAGIAELYEAALSAERHPELEIVITREEEMGLVGAKSLDTSGLRAKMGFILDGDVLDSIVIGGPSHMLIDVDITGRAAHAGMEPEKGISAIKAASHAISILKEGWVDKETTANVGIIEGGRIRNGVPEKATVKAECRSLNHDTCIAQSNVMKEVFEAAAKAIGARAEVKLTLGYKAARISENAPVVGKARKAIEKIGLKPETRVICGGTDASILNEKGIQTVVLGIGVRAEHSNDEHVLVADMESAVTLLHHLFDELCA